MENYDVVVVGSGFSGSVLAYQMAAVLRKRVLIVEKRAQIGGNMYDCLDDNGIRIQKYGPHVFHTNSTDVFRFLSQFCTWTEYHLKCEAVIDGQPTPTPFNFKTIDQFLAPGKADALKRALLARYPCASATILEMLQCEDGEIRAYAEFLFEKDYRPYTAKQWGLRPEEIDPTILRRVPVIFSDRDTYFTDRHQGLPDGGFTALFSRMLDHPLIAVQRNTDALDHISFSQNAAQYDGQSLPIVYTGAVDELFRYRYGHLPYRSLWFDYQSYGQKSYQNVAIVAHPLDMDCTRITEYTKLPHQSVGERTIIAKEYSLAYDRWAEKGNEPYYPVLTQESQNTYRRYREYANSYGNLFLCGRLADFKYYNMDAAVQNALCLFEHRLRKEVYGA